ncbi:MAG: MFS transporter [Candidatus Bathyarchaeia archaeon]
MVEYYKKAAILMGIGTFSDAADYAVVLMTMPLLIPAFKLTGYEVTWIVSIPWAVTLIASIIMGPFADRYGRKPCFIIGNLVAGISYLSAIFATHWIHFVIARSIAMATIPLTKALTVAILSESAPPEKRQTWISISGFIEDAGLTTFSVLLALSGVFPWISWQLMVTYLCILDIIVSIAGIFILKESEVWLERKKLIKEGKIPKEEVKTSWRSLFSSEVRTKYILAWLLTMVYAPVGLMAASGGYATYFQTVFLKWSPSLIGILGILSSVIRACIRGSFGPLADKIGRLNTMIVITLPAMICSILAWHTPVIIGVGMTLPVILFYFFNSQIGAFTGSPMEDVPRTFLAESVPTLARGTAGASVDVLRGLMNFIASTSVGLLALIIPPWTAYSLPPIIGGILGLALAFTAKKKGFETKGKILKE